MTVENGLDPCSEIILTVDDCYIGSGGNYDVFYTHNGFPDSLLNQTFVSNQITLTGLSVGSYTDIFVTDSKGCSSNSENLILAGTSCIEDCSNGLDDDLDGDLDCLDADCSPLVSASSNTPICAGGVLNLSESGGEAVSWVWSGPNGFSSSSQNPSITNVTSAAAGNYTVTVTNANTCTAIASVTVVINNCLADIGDFVWVDENADGIQNSGEPGIEGVTVSLYNSSDVLITSTTTDANGAYLFSSIGAGTYYIIFDVDSNAAGLTTYLGTSQNIGSPITDSDPNPATGATSLFLFNTALGDINSLDAGYIISCPPNDRGNIGIIRH